MIIEKKTWPKYFQMIKDETKTYDLRLTDFKCKESDTRVLKEYDPKTKQCNSVILT